MPTKRMLIDASHPEETRVVVVDGTKLEDYDVEVASRRQLKGNIYLAKVTRVEPSLQAAFVDYGGNRHGFLAFSEIHPDYYQIPVADRERLLAEEAALREAELAEAYEAEACEPATEEAESVEPASGGAAAMTAPAADGGEAAQAGGGEDEGRPRSQSHQSYQIQEVGGGDDEEDIERRPLRQSHRSYKIQEVIKRRQIMLVQVAKEERGSKGAALTTYLSLAGRYCVLMPNTVRGGGISRKIGNIADRKRLKKILAELDVPEGMAVIVRTAGLGRSKAEIKRDYDYMMRLWSNIREVTLQSTAPTLVYEEANLIKRSLRDLYERDIEEILIQGEAEYKVAREFMKLFIPSHAKRVKLYTDPLQPLFQAYHVEDQLDAMHQPVVQLRSGGYVVLNATEALISIDVNSGRSTRERHIEETALRTNLEAADEIARQLRLRDLAGLIVVDFIDMENSRNQGLVERRVKEAMKGDRARTQIGRISPFGLLELSRQRLRPSLLETSFEQCPHCQGMGVRRTTESTALAVLRKLEDEGRKQRASEIFVTAQPGVAGYLLNQKRRSVAAIEERFALNVSILSDPAFSAPDYRVERPRPVAARSEEGETAEAVEEAEEAAARPAEREDGGKRGRRRRGRRRRREDEQPAAVELVEEEADEGEELAAADEDDEEVADEAGAEDADAMRAEGEPDAAAEPGRKRRRRGKRGGRRRSRRPTDAPGAEASSVADGQTADAESDAAPSEIGEAADVDAADLAEEAEEAEREEAHAAQPASSTLDEADAEEADAEEADAEAADAEEADREEDSGASEEAVAELATDAATSADEPSLGHERTARSGTSTGEPAPDAGRREIIEIVEAGGVIEVIESAPDMPAVMEEAALSPGAEPSAETAEAAAAAEAPLHAEELVIAHAEEDTAGEPGEGDRQTSVRVLDHTYASERQQPEDGEAIKEGERPRRGWWQRLIT